MSEVQYLWTLMGGQVSVITTRSESSDLLQPGNRAKIVLDLRANSNAWAPTSVKPSFTLEIKPKVGASTLVSKTLSSGYAGGVII